MEKRKWLINFSSDIDAFKIVEYPNEVCTIFFGETEDTKTKEEAERNAMLIRTAPELLEALKELLLFSKKEVPQDYRNEYFELWKNCETVINKTYINA